MGSAASRWNRRLRLLSAVYVGAGIIDFSYHLILALRDADQRITWNDLIVAFQASLFWPIDLVVRLLSAG